MTSQPTITPTIEMTGAALTAGYASGEFTPVEAAESVLADIAARNPEINAFTDLDPAQVLQDAEASAARWERGCGVGLGAITARAESWWGWRIQTVCAEASMRERSRGR